MSEYHAQLSPSSAGRWINCPASVKLCENIPNETSQYAEAGRLAHSIADLKARKRFTPMSTRTYNSQLKKLQGDQFYDKSMDGYTDRYIDVLNEQAMTFTTMPFTAFETQVPVSGITSETKEDGSPATGTADCIQIGDGVLWVTDYKNGSGVPVSSENNPQMRIYAFGALELYRPFFGDSIQTVKMTIVQPALNSVSTWETTVAELNEWAESIATPAAVLASNGDCEPCPGEWCGSYFCPIKGTCRARAYEYLALEAFDSAVPPVLTDNEVGGILIRAKSLVSWIKELEDHVLKSLLSGKEIPGWKAVEGRSVRAWANQDEALEAIIAAGYPRELIYDYVPKTLAQLEKLIGTGQFNEIANDLIIKPPGKPTIAQESDKRPVYNAAEAAFTKI